MTSVRRVGDLAFDFGEGPLWDAREQALYWVDHMVPAIWRHAPATGDFRRWLLPTNTVGSLALTNSGDILVAADRAFHRLARDTGALTTLAAPVDMAEGVMLNDGKTDRRGRFFAGGIEPTFHRSTAALWRLDPDLTVARIESEIMCSNGPCWSTDDRVFYHADTGRQEIYAYDYNPDTGTAERKRVFAATKALGGFPDGATVDAHGFLWCAICEAGIVARFAPNGAIERTVSLPVKRVSSVMFGGPTLDTLFVTTIRRYQDGSVEHHPEAGALFAVDGLGVAGLAERRFAG